MGWLELLAGAELAAAGVIRTFFTAVHAHDGRAHSGSGGPSNSCPGEPSCITVLCTDGARQAELLCGEGIAAITAVLHEHHAGTCFLRLSLTVAALHAPF